MRRWIVTGSKTAIPTSPHARWRQTWQEITNGLPSGVYMQTGQGGSPAARLLFAGTELGVLSRSTMGAVAVLN